MFKLRRVLAHLENLLESILDGHLSLGRGSDLDILNGLGGTGTSIGTSVRHFVLVFFRAAINPERLIFAKTPL
jgi:hypothetical protein